MTKLEYLLMYQKADLKKQQLENAVRTTESRQKLNKITKLLREQQTTIQKLTEDADAQKTVLAKLLAQQEGLSHELELNHSEMETLEADDQVTAEELTEVMNEQWAQRETYRFCGPWNARFHVKNHVLTLQGIGPDNAPPEPGRRYKVAFNSHTAAGSGYFNRLKALLASPETQAQHHRIYTRDAVKTFLLTHPYDPTQTVNWITR